MSKLENHYPQKVVIFTGFIITYYYTNSQISDHAT